MMMYGHSHDKFDKEYLEHCLNSIYGSDSFHDCSYCSSLQDENVRLILRFRAIVQKALAKQREEMEREYKETYSMFEKRCKKYAEELASTKADLAEANYLIKKLLHEQIQCGRPLPKGEKEDECKTEVQEAKEENRAARESKDTD